MADGWTIRKTNVILETLRFELDGYDTRNEFYVLSLGLYDAIVGMKWLESNNAYVGGRDKQVIIHDDSNKVRILKGVKRSIKLNMISILQVKKSARRKCKLYCALIKWEGPTKEPNSKENFIIQEFKDVFLEKL